MVKQRTLARATATAAEHPTATGYAANHTPTPAAPDPATTRHA